MTINVSRDPCTGDYLLRGTLSAMEFMAAQGPAEIVAEVERTEPARESQEAPHTQEAK